MKTQLKLFKLFLKCICCELKNGHSIKNGVSLYKKITYLMTRSAPTGICLDIDTLENLNLNNQ